MFEIGERSPDALAVGTTLDASDALAVGTTIDASDALAVGTTVDLRSLSGAFVGRVAVGDSYLAALACNGTPLDALADAVFLVLLPALAREVVLFDVLGNATILLLLLLPLSLFVPLAGGCDTDFACFRA